MASLINQLIARGKGRRHPGDLFFVAGDKICKATERLGIYDIDEEELCHEGVPAFPCHIPGCNAVFDSLMLYEIHYNSLHRYPCSVCKKQLASAHLLDLHVAENHDSFFQAQAERIPMYLCYIEECGQKFSTPKERRDHCITLHKLPHDFRFGDSHEQKKKGKKHKKSHQTPLTDVNMEETDAQNATKRPAKDIVLGKGKRGGRMWHNQKSSNPSTSMDVEFESVTQDLRESLPISDEMS